MFHTAWDEMGERDAHIFFHEQKLFSKERFEEDNVYLQWQSLSFFPGHKLVRARISPQHIQIEKNGKLATIDINEEHRTFFLYDPETSDLLKKVIPLTPTSESIYLANKLLQLSLDKQNVVDYVQFFGAIVEAKDEPFYFLTHEDEIPWNPNITHTDKLEMLGRFSTIADRLPDRSGLHPVPKTPSLV